MSPPIVFIMDPLDGINTLVDTSFAFMLAGQALGHNIVHARPQNVSLEGDQVIIRGCMVRVHDQIEGYYTAIDSVQVNATECAAVFVRTDPPFDEHYLTVTWLLSFAEKQGAMIVNSPRGLREANEHLYSLNWLDLCPETLISNNHQQIAEFVQQHGGNAIAKPIDGHGGFGVVRLTTHDSNLNPLIDLLTAEGKQQIMIQRMLPEAVHGDRRILLVNGVARGVVRRTLAKDDHRGNVHVGGQALPETLSPRDLEICEAIGPRLREDGLYFVGLDVIGDYLIEVNVTSPTLVRELHRFGGPDLAAEVVGSAVNRSF